MSNTFSQTVSRGLFAVRPLILFIFAALTVFFAVQASQLKVNTDVRKMVPLQHPYIQNFLEHQSDVDLGNDVRLIVADVSNSDIFNDQYMQALRQITDDVFSLPGVDPSKISSLWTANVRWNEVTEEGFQGGEVIPDGYDGSASSLEQLRTNVLRSGQVGRLVADDFHSSIVHANLLDVLAEDSEVDIPTLSASLEEIRGRYEEQYPFIRIHIVGTAKKIGDVMAAAQEVAMFFFVTMVLTLLLLMIDARSARAGITVVVCSFIAVIWQLGIVTMMGFTIDPYSMLVPFLVFAIAVSHGVQIVNGFLNQRAQNLDANQAAQRTLTALVVPGSVALVSDAIGFLTLYLIDIGVIRELALAASIGVGVVILTNLVIVPLLLSVIGSGHRAVEKVAADGEVDGPLASLFVRFTRTPFAVASILIAVLGYAGGLYISKDLKIGDLDVGAPELWPDPCATETCERGYKPEERYRYNHDVGKLVANYSVSADVLIVMGAPPLEECNSYGAMSRIDDLSWVLLNTEGVQDVISITSVSKQINTNMNEGSMKWAAISRDQFANNNAMRVMPSSL